MDCAAARIFIDDLAAQSGASLFTQECAEPLGRFGVRAPDGCVWTYTKLEPNDTLTITHSIREPGTHKGGVVLSRIEGIERVGFAGASAGGPSWQKYMPVVQRKDALWIISE